MRVKIYGAGSIGNHLAHASRSLGWSVDLCDVDPRALQRTREDIYPNRYSSWDSGISLWSVDEAPCGGHDLIIVGTPPEHHISIAHAALAESPRAILIEKPLSTPAVDNAFDFLNDATRAGVTVFTGYTHVVSRSMAKVRALINEKVIGSSLSLEVDFREHWGGIFKAHPWLSGPADSYLGFTEKGGGSLGEHSHGLNLWQHLALELGCGRVSAVAALFDWVTDDGVAYDRSALLHLSTESGLVGRVAQDVVTIPTNKSARIQGSEGAIKWQAGFPAGFDTVEFTNSRGDVETWTFPKTRPEEFTYELEHVSAVLSGEESNNLISGQNGCETMAVIEAALASSNSEKKEAPNYRGLGS